MANCNPRKVVMRKCEDCPTMVPAFGNRKRCGDCSEAAYRRRQAEQKKRRHAAKKLEHRDAPASK